MIGVIQANAYRFTRQTGGWYAAVLLLLPTTAMTQPSVSTSATVAPTATATSATSAKPLKQLVTLIGANDNNDALSTATTPGGALTLVLVVKEPPPAHPRGELRILPFSSSGEQVAIAPAKIRIGENNKAERDSAPIALDKPAQIPFSLEFDRLRPGKTYKGQLYLSSADLLHHWEITLITEGRGIVAADPVPTLKFVKFPFTCTGSFAFTLYDKSEGGPYHHVRVRLEPAAGANSKALISNFTLDTFSFWGKGKAVDLEQRDPGRDAAVTLTKARTFTARIGPLSPGEYAGTLHFGGDEASDEAAEAKLPLLIQVRHHWLLPVLVILLGSAFGWFSSKYLVGARRARDLSRRIRELRTRADSLAGRSSPTEGWQFPSEGASLGFARVDVELSRLSRLTTSVTEVVFHGDEIEQRLNQAEQRLLGLESLHETRLRVQPSATGRPAAQRAIGTQLRSATDLLDRPTFASSDQARLKQLLDELEVWPKKDAFAGAYQQALLDYLRGDLCPKLQEVKALPTHDPIRSRLETLLANLPDEKAITGQNDPAELKKYDQAITRAILLWRERPRPWAKTVTEMETANAPLEDLFAEVDANVWATLKKGKDQLVLSRAAAGDKNAQTYEIVETDLIPNVPDVNPWQIRRHPLRVGWQIKPPQGDTRTTETDDLTLVQYFPSPGPVEVKANLHWKGEIVDIKPISFDVAQNPDYGKRWRLTKEWTEYAAIGLAALFAIVTAMGSQYDSTFGSFTQYVAIFIWAAGAGTGGNLFSQLGTTSAPGGASSSLK